MKGGRDGFEQLSVAKMRLNVFMGLRGVYRAAAQAAIMRTTGSRQPVWPQSPTKRGSTAGIKMGRQETAAPIACSLGSVYMMPLHAEQQAV